MKQWNKVKAVSFRVQEMAKPVYERQLVKRMRWNKGGLGIQEAYEMVLVRPEQHKKHDFELGLGPCGETVRELYYREDAQGFQVYQVTERSRKNFVYPWSELHGRITVTYLLQTETLPL